MTCTFLPSFLFSPKVFALLYVLLSACAMPAVCSFYASTQDRWLCQVNLWERLGCAIVAALWPVLIVIRIFLLGVQFFGWVLPY
jgi:hypothetical protein